MRKTIFCIALVTAVVGLVVGDALAQRGRGGGLGGGGARPSISRAPSVSRGPTMNRTPSMSRPSFSQPGAGSRPTPYRPSTLPSRPTTPSRPSTLPSRPGGGGLPSQRPSSGQLQDFLHLPSGPSGTRPSPGSRPGISQLPSGLDRNKISGAISDRYPGSGQKPFMPDWFQPGVSPLPGGPGEATRPAQRPGGGGEGRPIVPPGEHRPGWRPPDNRPPGWHPPGWRPPVPHPPIWHPWYRPGYRPPGYWWRPATAAVLTGWFVWTWPQPVYYTYGTGGTVYYENNVVYVNGQEYGTAEQYYENTAQLASSVPEISEEQADKMEWMPLGVFAITHDGVNDTSMLLQLAVDKNGVIGGTFYNESTEVAHPIEGMVDQKTQRAAWRAADESNPNVVMETGIYNLTQDEVSVLVHFGPETTQTWTMVRVEQPEQPEQE